MSDDTDGSAQKGEKWMETFDKMDISHNIKIAGNVIKSLNGDPTELNQHSRSSSTP